MKAYFVYLLQCSDGSYYSITNNVERRMSEHASGEDIHCYTFTRRPLTLVYRAEFREVTDAIAYEKRLKRWSRKKKEALISGNQELLEALSKNSQVRCIQNICLLTQNSAMVRLCSP